MTLSYSVRSSLFAALIGPSILVSIFILYHYLRSRALRSSLNNHAIILLLFFGLFETITDIAWQIYYYHNGIALILTPAFCLAWSYLSSTLYIAVHILMAWASIERHILIFYPNWFGTRRKRLYFHYLPLVACILYPAIFYFLMIIALPCNSPLNYIYRSCGRYACVVRVPWVSSWDSIVNYIMPALIIVIFSMILFVRIFYRRHRARQRIEWKKYKKLAIQLLPISVLYIALQLPPTVLYAAYTVGVPFSVGIEYYGDGLYFTYWIILLTPFVSVVSLPEWKTKCRNLFFFCRKRNAVGVETLTVVRSKIGQTPAAALIARY